MNNAFVSVWGPARIFFSCLWFFLYFRGVEWGEGDILNESELMFWVGIGDLRLNVVSDTFFLINMGNKYVF